MSCSHTSVGQFRAAVQTEAARLGGLCDTWRPVCDAAAAGVPEEVLGDIHVAIGQAELLKKERFTQFSGLIDNCEFKKGEKETTIQDLQGFWDIVCFQIEDIVKKFSALDERQRNGWKEPEKPKPVSIKPKPAPAPAKKAAARPRPGASALRAHILAQRRQLAQQNAAEPSTAAAKSPARKTPVKKSPANKTPVKKSPANKTPVKKSPANPKVSVKSVSPANVSGVAPKKTPVKLIFKSKDKENIPQESFTKAVSPGKLNVFDAGFFKVSTPSKGRSLSASVTPVKTGPGSPRVLSSSLLKAQVKASPLQHKDYSPCMRITRSMKRLHMPQD